MKKNYFLFVLFAFSILTINAQLTCDFEDCPGEDCLESDPYGPTLCSNDQNHTPGGNWSGLIPDDGVTDAILDLGNKIFGTWGLEFYMYVPSNKEAYWNIQGQVPIGAGEWAVGNIFFNRDIANPGRGYIDWGTTSTADDTYFDFPHDQWFQIIVNVDISTGITTATWQFGVAGIEVVSWLPFADGNGNHPTSLGGMDFFSISTDNILYLDDITYANYFLPIADYIFIDDMEVYTNGQPISGGYWTDYGCGGGAGCSLMASSNQAHSGSLSGLVPGDGTTDAVLDLGNKTDGQWGLEFYMYVPSDKEASWNIQGNLTTQRNGEEVVGNIYFNKDLLDPGNAYIDWSTTDTADDTYFSFPHDQWFQVLVNVDISAGISIATWQFGVDGIEVIPAGTPFANGNGTYPSGYGGFEFLSVSTDNEYYLDDFVFQGSFFSLDVTDLKAKGFIYYPNPVKDELHLKADETITKVSIFNMLGQEVYNKNIDEIEHIIDTSDLTNGTYIVKVTIGDTIGTIKIVK